MHSDRTVGISKCNIVIYVHVTSMMTLLYQQTFYEMVHTLYNQQTQQMYVCS